MKMGRTIISVIIKILVGIIGFSIGSIFGDRFGGAILFSMISGIGCLVYTLDNQQEQE